jgi:hypothetical protein
MKMLRFSVAFAFCLFVGPVGGFAQAPAKPIAPAVPPSEGPAQAPAAVAPPVAAAPAAPAVVRAPVPPPGASHYDAKGRPVFPSTAAGIKARRRYNYQVELANQAAEAKAWNAYVEKMGPIVAAQQRQQFLDQQRAFQLQMEVARTNAIIREAAAAEKNAEVNRQRLQLEQYQSYRDGIR